MSATHTGDNFSWNGIRAPVQYLIRVSRYIHYQHIDTDIEQDISRFILSNVYTNRHDDIGRYIQYPYDGPSGPMQTDKAFYSFWDENLKPHIEAVFDVFGSCATQKQMKETIKSFDEAKKVSRSLMYLIHDAQCSQICVFIRLSFT